AGSSGSRQGPPPRQDGAPGPAGPCSCGRLRTLADGGLGESRHLIVRGGGGLQDRDGEGGPGPFTEAHAEIEEGDESHPREEPGVPRPGRAMAGKAVGDDIRSLGEEGGKPRAHHKAVEDDRDAGMTGGQNGPGDRRRLTATNAPQRLGGRYG